MLRIAVLAILVLAVTTLATVPVVSPPAEHEDHPWLHAPVPDVPEDRTGAEGTSRCLKTAAPDHSLTAGTGDRRTLPTPGPFTDWGDDVLVGATGSNPTLGWLTSDVAPNGDIYIGVLDPGDGTEDTATIWRSTDGGESWEQFIRMGPGTTGLIYHQLRIGEDASGTWIYVFGVYPGAGGDGGVQVYRVRPDLSGGHWTQIAAGDTLVQLGVDRNIEDPNHLFILWQTEGGRVYRMSSADSAQTWDNLGYVSGDACDPFVAAGGDGYCYLIYERRDSSYVRVGRYTNNMINPTYIFNSLDPSGPQSWRPSVAADREDPGGSQVAVALYCHLNASGNVVPHYGWTTDGGVSWDYSFWPVTNQARATWDARFPYIRRSYEDPAGLFRAVVSMPEPTAAWDTLVYACTRTSDPTTWEERATPNDFRMTAEFGARVDRSTTLGGGYVAYRELGQPDIYFDGWNFTGVQEGVRLGPVPGAGFRLTTVANGDAGIILELCRPTGVKARLFDRTGRAVGASYSAVLGPGSHDLPLASGRLSSGVYFLALVLDGRPHTVRVVRLR